MGFGIGKEQLWAVVSGLSIFQVNGHFSMDYFRMVTERLFNSEQAFLRDFKNYFLPLALTVLFALQSLSFNKWLDIYSKTYFARLFFKA